MGLGLSENEARLYSLMLLHPKSTVQELQQKSPFPRTMLYYVLKQLMEKNLISLVKQKFRSVYVAEDPERLYDLLDQRQKQFEIHKADTRKIIPELRRAYRLSSERPGTTLFEGLDQYKAALDDIFTTEADIMYVYVPRDGDNKPGLELRLECDKKRQKKDIAMHLLVADEKNAQGLKKQYKNNRLVQIRMIPADRDIEDVDIRLYTGKMLYTRYNKREPISLLIDDVPLYKMQRMLFQNLWHLSKKIR